MPTPEQDFIREYIARNREAIALTGDKIFYFGELGMQEHETAALLTGLLEKDGFAVERGIAGFPTGFCAQWGSGKPVVAIVTEYDSVPDNSQMSGEPEQKAIVEGAPGHCEGHNLNASVLIGAALAAKATMERFALPGTLKVFGGPAEEQLISRPYMVRDGYFDDADVVFHDHVGAEFSTGYGLSQQALISAVFHFHGESAHAGVAPWKGRDALDAAVLMDMGMAQYREHMTPGMSAQRVIAKGGDQPNVVPRHASAWWFFREASAAGAEALFARGKQIAEGAALMTDTRLEVEVLSAVWPFRANRTLAETLQRNIERVGAPQWTQEEHDLARALQAKVGAPVEGLKTNVKPLAGAIRQRPSANDIGDISWKTPMAKLYFPGNAPGLSAHHWAAGVTLAHSIGHKGAAAGAEVLAGAIVDCLTQVELVTEAKRTFREEIGDVIYRPLIPPDQKPPLALNREAMERFRPLMETYYIREEPVFK
jgi:aminobenzoyl-glutamate utilization protein B